MLPPLILSVASLIIHLLVDMKLDRATSLLLIALYAGYMVFTYQMTANDD